MEVKEKTQGQHMITETGIEVLPPEIARTFDSETTADMISRGMILKNQRKAADRNREQVRGVPPFEEWPDRFKKHRVKDDWMFVRKKDSD